MDTITPSSGNVFADLELPDSVEKKAKVRLAVLVNDAVAEKRLSQVAAAALLGCTQPKVSAVANYKLSGFSMARLLGFLTELHRDVEITIHKTDHRGEIKVHALA